MTIEEWLEARPVTTLLAALILFVLAGAVVYVFARLILNSLSHATRAQQPVTTLMAILGTLSVVALIGALFTRDESAFTIAATGMGAFAGALTARWQTMPDPEAPEDTPPDVWDRPEDDQDTPEAPEAPEDTSDPDADADDAD